MNEKLLGDFIRKHGVREKLFGELCTIELFIPRR